MLDRTKKVLLTGAQGMVGSAMLKTLQVAGFKNILAVGRHDLNLSDWVAVDKFFAEQKPAYVFMIAAKVGGIKANIADPTGFLLQNLKIATNLFEACHKHKTLKNLFLGSSCIYPQNAPQPMKEEYLLTGPLEPTNEGYALAKIAGLKLAEFYYKQYNMLTVCPLPCNIYGTNDHYDLEKSHVLSALIKRFYDAKQEGKDQVTLWGTGIARREFIHVNDVAAGLLFLMDNYKQPNILNLGTGSDVSIGELAKIIASKVGYEGQINWDASKPNGMLKKCMDTSKMVALGFKPQISLLSGIKQSIQEYAALKATV
jgi:GDP-L-fucose synthase